MTRPSTPCPAVDADTLATIDDILVDWNATDRARANARVTVVRFAAWLTERSLELGTASARDCLEWLRQRGGEVKAVTVAKNWSELRAFYRCAEADPILDLLNGKTSPMARIKMPRHPKYAATHAATVAEADALIRAFDMRTGTGLRNAAMVSLMFRSGLRVGEVARLDLVHLDLDKRTVHLGVTKNLEPRTPPLHPETIRLLQRYLRRRGNWNGPLFVNLGQRRVSDRLPTGAIQTVIKRAAVKAGVAHVTPHTLRRGFAVEYLTHGGDAATLMIAGGWSDDTMIVRYLGNQRATTAQAVYDSVAARQVAARSRANLRAVQ